MLSNSFISPCFLIYLIYISFLSGFFSQLFQVVLILFSWLHGFLLGIICSAAVIFPLHLIVRFSSPAYQPCLLLSTTTYIPVSLQTPFTGECCFQAMCCCPDSCEATRLRLRAVFLFQTYQPFFSICLFAFESFSHSSADIMVTMWMFYETWVFYFSVPIILVDNKLSIIWAGVAFPLKGGLYFRKIHLVTMLVA